MIFADDTSLFSVVSVSVILYDQTFNNSFKEKLESIQYNARLALTGAIRGTSKEKICQE